MHDHPFPFMGLLMSVYICYSDQVHNHLFLSAANEMPVITSLNSSVSAETLCRCHLILKPPMTAHSSSSDGSPGTCCLGNHPEPVFTHGSGSFAQLHVCGGFLTGPGKSLFSLQGVEARPQQLSTSSSRAAGRGPKPLKPHNTKYRSSINLFCGFRDVQKTLTV